MIFAANWKMNITPAEARAFAGDFLARVSAREGRSLLFFPSAIALEAAATAFSSRSDVQVGAQDVYWMPKGAFTGATSVALARAAGATCALVGHSERRQAVGETDADTRRKIRALLDGGVTPLLCVGESQAMYERDLTMPTVLGQLEAAIDGLSAEERSRLVVAYEPVWAIGTGYTATPEDAAVVHSAIRHALGTDQVPVLYGGSVNKANVAGFLLRPEIDGVLVGGASLEAAGWAEVVTLGTQAKVDSGAKG